MAREIIAILRGIHPHEIADIANVLVESGITKIEVPLNSPDPFTSIGKLASAVGDKAMVGAGTVLTLRDVEQVADAGGKMIVSPDCNPEVIQATKSAGLHSYPGVFTATECFTALRNGADGLKIFPSFLMGPTGLSALRAVLPAHTAIYAVGGVGQDNFIPWFEAGATGFGIGTGIYKPGDSPQDVAEKAQKIVTAYDGAIAN